MKVGGKFREGKGGQILGAGGMSGGANMTMGGEGVGGANMTRGNGGLEEREEQIRWGVLGEQV